MSEEQKNASANAMIEATRSRASFSGHGTALGAGGYRNRDENDYGDTCEFLDDPGESIAINPGEDGLQSILIGVTWENIKAQKAGLFSGLLKKTTHVGVDLDVGCLYELKDGTRGAIQAFGEKFGNFEESPYIALSGDDRTGNKEGYDEFILVNGDHWNKIKRILIYIYIYEGAPSWSDIKPQIIVDVPGEQDLIVTLGAHNDALSLCAVGELENARGGIKLTNQTEYFPGHEEMDRAFGFGLEWGDGKK